MRKWKWLLVMLALLLMVVVACAPAPPPTTPPGPTAPATPTVEIPRAEVMWYTCAVGTFGYTAPTIVADIVRRHSAGKILINCSPVACTGECARLAREEKCLVSTITPDYAYSSVFGTTPFAGAPSDAAQALWPYCYAPQYFVVLADSPAKTVYDLNGKSVFVLAPPTHASMMVDHIQGVLGLKFDVRYGGYTAGFENLGDGVVDAIYRSTASQADEAALGVTHPFRIIPTPDEFFQKEADQYYNGHILVPKLPLPAVFRKNMEPVHSGPLPEEIWVNPPCFSANKDVDADVIYWIVKLFWENYDEAVEAHATWGDVTIDDVTAGVVPDWWPYHPGAVRYYKEIGIM